MAGIGSAETYMEIDTNLISTLLNNDFTTKFLEVTKNYMEATTQEAKKEYWYDMVDYIMGQIRVKASVSYERVFGINGVPPSSWTYPDSRLQTDNFKYIWPVDNNSTSDFFGMYKQYAKRVTDSDGTTRMAYSFPVFNIKLRDTAGDVFFDSAREPSWYHYTTPYDSWTNYKWRFHDDNNVDKGTTLNQEYGTYIDVTSNSNAMNIKADNDKNNWGLDANGYQYVYQGIANTSDFTTTTGPYIKSNVWIQVQDVDDNTKLNWIKVTKAVTLTDSEGNEIVYNLGKPFPAEPQTSRDIAAMFRDEGVAEHTVNNIGFEVVGGYAESTDTLDAFGAAQKSGELGTVQIGSDDTSRVNNDIISFVFKRGSGDDQLGYIKVSVAKQNVYTPQLYVLYTGEEPEPEPQ
jgi:hypothetical protein